MLCGIKERRNTTAEKTVDIYLHSMRPFFCNPITPSRSALVYLSTWFLGHGPWITQPPSRVHLTVWHHLSTFVDIHFLQWKITAKEKALPPWYRSYFSYFVIPLLEGRAGEHVNSLATGSLSFCHYSLLVKELCLNRNNDNVFALIG